MIRDYAFTMSVMVGDIEYIGYYEHDTGRQFDLIGVKRIGTWTTGTIILPPNERKNLAHMDKRLSYDALNTRAKRTKTYKVERVLAEEIRDELEDIKKDVFLYKI